MNIQHSKKKKKKKNDFFAIERPFSTRRWRFESCARRFGPYVYLTDVAEELTMIDEGTLRALQGELESPRGATSAASFLGPPQNPFKPLVKIFEKRYTQSHFDFAGCDSIKT